MSRGFRSPRQGPRGAGAGVASCGGAAPGRDEGGSGDECAPGGQAQEKGDRVVAAEAATRKFKALWKAEIQVTDKLHGDLLVRKPLVDVGIAIRRRFWARERLVASKDWGHEYAADVTVMQIGKLAKCQS
ncbi:hypothetical protein LZ554_006140 [Drepanopeziza brunnea f. sp. 'monogermtubi']|nr:hypothetical protein LZ554_006140 [Drepanopeziza brunnea f. sp. 'monogermtubi']